MDQRTSLAKARFFIGGDKMESAFYTQDEIRILTGVKVKKKTMCKVLRSQKIPFSVDINGFPVVKRDFLTTTKKTEEKLKPKWQSNALSHKT